jgi:hypothetical protein
MVPANYNLAVISSEQSSLFYGRRVVTAGWGLNENNILPPKMRAVELTVLHMAECVNTVSRLHGSRIKMHHRYICSNANPHAVMNSVSSSF